MSEQMLLNSVVLLACKLGEELNIYIRETNIDYLKCEGVSAQTKEVKYTLLFTSQCLQSCRSCLHQPAAVMRSTQLLVQGQSILSDVCWTNFQSCGAETAVVLLLSTCSLLHSLSLLCWRPLTLRYSRTTDATNTQQHSSFKHSSFHLYTGVTIYYILYSIYFLFLFFGTLNL